MLDYYCGLEEKERGRLRLERERRREKRAREKAALLQRSGVGLGTGTSVRGTVGGGGWDGVNEWLQQQQQQAEVEGSDDDDDVDLNAIDGDEYYERAVDEGWRVELGKMEIRWEDNTLSEAEYKEVVTLPVNLLENGRTDEELDRYLHMIHLRGYRDLVEISFRWVKEEGSPHREPVREGGEDEDSCIVIDED